MMLTALTLMHLQGCTFNEDLNYYDLTGTVKIPIAATQFVYGFDDEEQLIDDIRGMGPVYLGVFPSIQEGLYPFPHPEMGPILAEGQDGNAYPYGGNTIGRFDWACYEQLVCKVVTGRYSDYNDILDFFGTVLDDNVRTYDGHIVGSGDEYRERCFEYEYAAGDQEMLFVGVRNFEVEGDYLVAEASIPHIPFNEGMQVWGWIDMPSPSFEFNTCDPSVGDTVNYYNESYDLGTNAIDVLNYPGKYIDFGDWIAQTPFTITDPSEPFELELGFHYVDEE
jgi:hypothetical protein